MIGQNTVFPVGYHYFNKNQAYNYQLNRSYSLGFMNYEDIHAIGSKIKTFEDWKTKMIKLAEKDETEERLLNASFYFRAAEFYTMKDDSPDKEYFYDRFTDLFYRAIDPDSVERIFILYTDNAKIPVIKVNAKNERKGTIVIHGGFDSFIEEWYFMMKYLSDGGFDVIGFEGPGQGHITYNTYGAHGSL